MKTIGPKAELQAKLRETPKKIDLLKSRIDEMEAEARNVSTLTFQ